LAQDAARCRYRSIVRGPPRSRKPAHRVSGWPREAAGTAPAGHANQRPIWSG
jgi:hypothetical protein